MKLTVIRKFISNVILIITISLLGVFYFSRLKTPPFFVDEYHFLRKSYYFDLFFVNRNVNDPRFEVEDEPLQPKVGTYIYGAALHLYGVKNIDVFLSKIHFNDENAYGGSWWLTLWDEKLSKFPNNLQNILKLILYGREVSVIFLLSSLTVIFIVGKRIFGNLFAVISTLLVGFNNLVLNTGLLATTDSMLLFFSFISLLFVFFLNERLFSKDNKNIVFVSLLLGVSSAFGVGVKISGILILVFVVLYYFGAFFSNWGSRQMCKTIIKSLVITLSTFFTIFIFLHPYLYKDFLIRFPLMFTGRLEGTKISQVMDPVNSITSRFQALRIIISDILIPGGHYLNFEKSAFPIDLILFLAGLVLLLKRILASWKARHWVSNELILMLWFITMFIGLTLYLRNNWDRYFLETEVITTFIEALSLSFAIKLYIRSLRKIFVYDFRKLRKRRH